MDPQVLEHHLLSRLKFRQLKLLVTVDEERNILKASQVLNMAQPAATKNIRELEETLGISLFKRSSRGVTPTLYGEVIIKHAKLIISQIHHVSEELTSLQHGVTGHITVGTLLAATSELLPRSIAVLRKERPNITITVREGTNDVLMPALRVGDIDVVLGRLPQFREREGLKQEVLYNDEFSIVVRKGHPLTKKKKLKLGNLLEEDWILALPQTSLRRQFEKEFRDAGHEPPVVAVESVSILNNYHLLLDSDMLCVMPNMVAQRLDGLVALPIKFDTSPTSVPATTRANANLAPAVDYFLDTLRRVSESMNPS